MILTYLLFVLGLVFLLAGAQWLVDSSSGIAARYEIPPVFVGVVIVAFATSAPEVAVSLDAALAGEAAVALGNVVGSNIANILVILGISALLAPIAIRRRMVLLDVPIVIALSVLVYLLSLDGLLQLWEGAIMLVLFIGFIIFQVRQIQKESGPEETHSEGPPKVEHPLPVQIGIFVVGLGTLILGAHWMVDSAVEIARSLGMSELVIGLTIIAIGTSLPELATSVMAAFQGKQDLSVGNVLGSNIFNLLFVLGLSSVVSNGFEVSEAAIALDLPFMVAVSIACLPIFFTGHRITRWEGGVFIFYYCAYLAYLFLDVTGHELLPRFNAVMIWFVVPITVLTLGVLATRAWYLNRLKKKADDLSKQGPG
ncbi:calcium/sodium antiporter [Aliifodinibius sp. S!AR15-10]|uniref:calcium/sodium antiporter n=1 Tax=Aliifodinibius sp. S!AR15-10 TaxID=2950437 RepID=UPI00285AEFAB|nr:calcium/sodium antiporter [Aliifodinibius sp. S!AR15-10]MDR8392192.1 calcium/sodium antiporter [Aliifodinibius sp. S!AR15-10]